LAPQYPPLIIKSFVTLLKSELLYFPAFARFTKFVTAFGACSGKSRIVMSPYEV